MKNSTEHWNKIFSNSKDNQLGWYESDFSQTLKFVEKIDNWQNARIFVAGAGTSALVEALLNSNAHLILNDLSTKAIELLKAKYDKHNPKITWNCQDLSKTLPLNLGDVDIWIDRAVLHFITNDEQIGQYFRNVNAVVKSRGYALLAEFSKSGAQQCAGLDVRRYDLPDFEDNLPQFQLISSEEYTYINPNGDPRPYIYALFKRDTRPKL
jgi:2-polyprenyl-3-methyl-5-hydroxy-6-metoxy-1,4-benzoquinol methylase